MLEVQGVTVVEVDAPPAATLDRMWRQRWSAAGMAAEAPWCSSGPGHASVRLPTERAGPLLALAAELAGQVPRSRVAKPDHYSDRAYWALRKLVMAQEPICALCGHPWDPAAPPRSPRAFTLDHVVPLSLGGSLLDRANARAAHYSCNARRGNTTRRPGAPAPALCPDCRRPHCRRPTGYVTRCW